MGEKPTDDLDAEGGAAPEASAASESGEPAERVDWSALMKAHGLDEAAADARPSNPVALPSLVASMGPLHAADAGDDVDLDVPGGRAARRTRRTAGAIAAAVVLVSAGAAGMWIYSQRTDKAEPPPQAEPRIAAAEPAAPVVAASRPAPAPAVVPGATLEPAVAEHVQPPRESAPDKSPPAQPERSASESAVAPKQAKRSDSRPPDPKRHDSKRPDTGKPEASGPDPGQPDPEESAKTPPPPVTPSGPLPLAPQDQDVGAAAQTIESDLSKCATENSVTGTAAIKMKVNPDGTVAWVAAKDGGPQFQACVSKAFRKVRLPASQSGGTVRHTLDFP